jgi:hypothetical protein
LNSSTESGTNSPSIKRPSVTTIAEDEARKGTNFTNESATTTADEKQFRPENGGEVESVKVEESTISLPSTMVVEKC